MSSEKLTGLWLLLESLYDNCIKLISLDEDITREIGMEMENLKNDYFSSMFLAFLRKNLGSFFLAWQYEYYYISLLSKENNPFFAPAINELEAYYYGLEKLLFSLYYSDLNINDFFFRAEKEKTLKKFGIFKKSHYRVIRVSIKSST